MKWSLKRKEKETIMHDIIEAKLLAVLTNLSSFKMSRDESRTCRTQQYLLTRHGFRINTDIWIGLQIKRRYHDFVHLLMVLSIIY